MKKPLPVITFLASLAFTSTTSRATGIPVVDALHVSVSEVNWIQNLSQWFTSAANQVEQIGNQVQQIRQMVDYLERYGNPQDLAGQLGMEKIQQLGELTAAGDSYRDMVDHADGTYALRRTAEGIFRKLPDRMADGTALNLDPDAFRKFALHGQLTDSYYQRSGDLKTAREEIRAEIERTLKEVDSASTDAEVARATAKLTGLSAQQEQLSREEALAAAQSTVAANDITINNQARRQAAATAYDQEHDKAMKAATRFTVPEPKSAGAIPE
ncbi:MAG: hypothetical protein V4726_00135 [Verrucomicrobiota bacterium]